MIYLDNAATTMVKPDCVIQAVCGAMKSFGNSGRGAHEAALGASRTVFEARQKLASFFGASDPTQIVFTANSTEALNIAIKGLFGPGDHIITTVMEHNSVLRPLYELEQKGTELSFVTCDPQGNPLYEQFSALIQTNTRAIICTHASNLTGNIVDIKRVSDVACENGLLLLVDASQTAGFLDIDVTDLGIDVLCFTGHKSLMGPQGTGGMVVRPGLVIRPLLSGGSGVQTYSKEHPREMPTALEAGTLNGHGIAGLEAAVDFIMQTGSETIRKREMDLMWRFYDGIKDIPEITVYGDFRDRTAYRCPIVALNVRPFDSAEVNNELLMTYDIAVRSGAHCAPLMHEHFGTVSQGAVRFSFSWHNTEEEIDAAIAAIKEIAKEARK